MPVATKLIDQVVEAYRVPHQAGPFLLKGDVNAMIASGVSSFQRWVL